MNKPQSLNTYWYTAFVLITHVTAAHLLVMLSFLLSPKLLPLAFPLSLIISGTLGIYLGSRVGFSNKEKTAPLLYSIAIIALSFVFSAFYFDLSWDGEWYHQAAIYHIRSDWNPIFEPIRTFNEHNDASILHFPKGSWYYAASVYATFGNFEAGKSLNILVLAATVLVTYAVLREYDISKIKAGSLTSMLVLNPVIWSEVTTYLVDGVLILSLVLYLSCLFSAYRKPAILNVSIGAMAIICVINIKFTGLVFLSFLSAFAFAYFFIWKKKYVLKFLLFHIISFFLSVIVFGYNPYVTNTLERGHPLYPLMGTAKYPSTFADGFDANEVYETPKNMQGKPMMTRFFYAHFGRPGNAPYNNEENAELILPFSSKIKDWSAYHYHETRVSGFGPFFSGILIISFCLLLWVLITVKSSRWVLLFLLAAISSTLLLSRHFWWPRFGPQLWLLPILPVMACFWRKHAKGQFLFWALSFLIIANGLIVLFIHLKWETRSSTRLYKQLSDLRTQNRPLEANFGFFEKSTAEKLSKWGITYDIIPMDTLMKGPHTELMSVVEGYPGAVVYRQKETKN
jgi:hypothetical protein